MEQICRDAHYRYRIMNSGAGHDAQVFGLYLDTVMLFIPSQDGISHSPQGIFTDRGYGACGTGIDCYYAVPR